MNRALDHPLTTINCALDGMAAVVQLLIEVETINTKTIGYQLSLASARKQYDVIKHQALLFSFGRTSIDLFVTCVR